MSQRSTASQPAVARHLMWLCDVDPSQENSMAYDPRRDDALRLLAMRWDECTALEPTITLITTYTRSIYY